MKLTRRRFIKLAGAAGVAGSVGCGEASEADLDPAEEFDSPPDEMLDAGAGDLDAAVEEDAATGTDGGATGLDASIDAGSDVPVGPPRDAGVEPPRDVPVTPPRVDAGRDAGPPPLAHPDFRDLPERRTQFPLGVMAGDATDTSVMFWTKYSGDASVVLRVLEMDGNRIAAVRYNGRVTPSGGGFVRAVVTGLRPNRRHLYAFLLGGATSPPRARPSSSTAPRAAAARTATASGAASAGGAPRRSSSSTAAASAAPPPARRTRRAARPTSPAGRWTGSRRGFAPRPACSSSSSARCPSSTAPGPTATTGTATPRSAGRSSTTSTTTASAAWCGCRATCTSAACAASRRPGPWSDIWEVVMGPSGSNCDGRPPIRESQWPVFVHEVHNFVRFHADPASRTLTVEFIDRDGDRIPNSRWTHTF